MSVSSPFAEKTGSVLGNFMIPAAAILGSLVAFGVFSNKHKNHSHSHATTKSVIVPKKVSYPVTKKSSPLISKVNPVSTPTEEVSTPTEEEVKPEPTLQPKSVSVPKDAVEVLESTSKKSAAPEEMTAEQTFEQYRQAMLHTGPRDMEYQARAEMQSKGGMGNNAMWREQTASLRKSLEKDAATLLDEMNVSINDRVVSDFNNIRYA
jgi:hypothetical protein